MSVLILAYYSVKDPVFQSAVLQYFKAYSKLIPHKLILVTYENHRFPLSQNECRDIEKELSRYGITWYRLRWHSGRFKVIKKCYDVLRSLWAARKLKKRYNIKWIYSEGFPGAIIGYLCCHILKLSHIVHSFEPHADYMMEAGVWTTKSWEYKCLKHFEKKVALSASCILTATEGMIQNLHSWGVDRNRLYRVPSCVDLEVFKPIEEQRKLIRSKLGFTSKDIIVVYLGKIDGMYWSRELFEFIEYFVNHTGVNYKFLILNYSDHKIIREQLSVRGVDLDKYQILSADHDKVSHYLSAADIGLVAVRQKPSKRFCSPIKTGEYLACGLPVVVPVGISDDYQKLVDEGLGVPVHSTAASQMKQLPQQVEAFLRNGERAEIGKNARNYASNNRALENYTEVYLEVFECSRL